MTLETRIKSLFMSSPYPGDLKFGGQPTGLLYALSLLVERKERKYQDRDRVKQEVEVWCPNGVENVENSQFENELVKNLRERKPKIVGISTFSVSYQNAVQIKDLVKRISPETIVVFGGAHIDNSVKYTRQKGKLDADFEIAGDGMYLLYQLYQTIEQNPLATTDDIKRIVSENAGSFNNLAGAGLLMYEKAEKLVEVKTKGEPAKLEDTPFIRRYVLKDEDKLSRSFSSLFSGKTIQIIVGQGCPNSCEFCSEGIKRAWYADDSPRSRNYLRSLSHLEQELQHVKAEGYSSIFFDDSTFLAKPKEYLGKLFNLLKKYGLEWGCQTTIGTVDANRELVARMKESGCSYVYLGLETFDGELRDSFGSQKYGGVSAESALETLCQEGVRTGVSLTFGHPSHFDKYETTHETESSVRYTIDKTGQLIEKYPNICMVSLNLVTYHPGTRYSERYEEKVLPVEFTANINNTSPYKSFEEGIGQHPYGMTPELASFIKDYARTKLKDKVVM